MSQTKVKSKDLKTVYGTGKAKFLENGKPYKVHALAAEKLIKKGVATDTAPKAKK